MKIQTTFRYKYNLNTICSYFLAILIIFTTNSILLATNIFKPHNTKFRMLIVLIMAMISIFSLMRHKVDVKDTKLLRIIAISAIVLFYVLVAKTNRMVYIKITMFVILVSMIYFVSVGKNDSLMKAFVNVVVVLSVISLFFYIFGSFLHIISPTGIVRYSWGEKDKTCYHYFWIYYEAQTLDFLGFKDLVRNSSIFPEGTMFGFVLSIAIGYELLIKETYNKIKLLILFITVFTTTATLAMVSAIMVVVFRIMANMLKNHTISWRKIGLFMLVIIGLIGALVVFNYKFSTDKGEGSMKVRLDHLVACTKAWIDHPFNGVGFNNLDAVIAYAKYKQGISVGLLYILACGGLVLGSIFILPVLSNILINYNHKRFRMMFFEILILVLITVNAVTNTSVVLILIGYFTAGSYMNVKESNAVITFVNKHLLLKGDKI